MRERFKKSVIVTFKCQRPYHIEHTSSRPITEVKQCWVQSVLGWVTAWEHWMLLASLFCLFWSLVAFSGHFLATHAIPKSPNVPKTSSTFFPLDNRGRWRTFASKLWLLRRISIGISNPFLPLCNSDSLNPDPKSRKRVVEAFTYWKPSVGTVGNQGTWERLKVQLHPFQHFFGIASRPFG